MSELFCHEFAEANRSWSACFRFHEMWKHTFQKLSLGASLLVYLEHGRIATLEEVATAIGGQSGRVIFTTVKTTSGKFLPFQICCLK